MACKTQNFSNHVDANIIQFPSEISANSIKYAESGAGLCQKVADKDLSQPLEALCADAEKYNDEFRRKPVSRSEFSFKASTITAVDSQAMRGDTPKDAKVFLAFGETTLSSRNRIRLEEKSEIMVLSFTSKNGEADKLMIRVCVYPRLEKSAENGETIDINQCKYGGSTYVSQVGQREKLLEIATMSKPFQVGLKFDDSLVLNSQAIPNAINNAAVLWFGEMEE